MHILPALWTLTVIPIIPWKRRSSVWFTHFTSLSKRLLSLPLRGSLPTDREVPSAQVVHKTKTSVTQNKRVFIAPFHPAGPQAGSPVGQAAILSGGQGRYVSESRRLANVGGVTRPA